MPRYEAALETPLGWSRPGDPFECEDIAVIAFNGRRFAWHAATTEGGEQLLPVVSVVVRDGNDYAEERLLTNEFLSALCFLVDEPISVVAVAAAGYKEELDRPLLGQPGYGVTHLLPPPSAISTAESERLRLVLGLYREGRTAGSPFYRFLAFYNALDASFDNDEERRDRYVREEMADKDVPVTHRAAEFDWAGYFRDNLRNAVAHAVRRSGKPVLNPDDLADRGALDRGSAWIAALTRSNVEQRWPNGVGPAYGSRDWCS